MKHLALGVIGALLVLTGCSGDENVAAPLAPPIDNGGPTTSSFEINFTDVDDAAFLYVNGALVDEYDRPARVQLDPYLLTGENSIEIILGNGGCFATSLSVEIFENGRSVGPRRVFRQDVSHCGYQLSWKYSVNTAGGVVQVQ